MRFKKYGWLFFLVFPTTVWAADTDSNANAQQPQTLVGRVDKVLSSDIMTVMVDQNKVYVRLAGIAAPDPQQPFGNQSKTFLANLVGNKVVVMRQIGIDPCERVVAIMWLDGDKKGLDVSSRMVAAGAAWVYRRYANSDFLIKLEDQAREHHAGLWGLPEKQQIAPWEWRKQAHFQGYVPVDECRITPQSSDYSTGYRWLSPEFSMNPTNGY